MIRDTETAEHQRHRENFKSTKGKSCERRQEKIIRLTTSFSSPVRPEDRRGYLQSTNEK